MSDLIDFGLPVAIFVVFVVVPVLVEVRRRALARRHFSYVRAEGAGWLPFWIPLVGVGAARRRSLYFGKCRTCGEETNDDGAPMALLARHGRAHERWRAGAPSVPRPESPKP